MRHSKNEWNAKLYDGKFDFVSEYGKDVIELLMPKAGERVLDLGCGTGDLTNEIFKSGANPVGIDFSKKMITEAIAKYPEIKFHVASAEEFRSEEKFDAIFSNAAIHWMNPKKVVETISEALKSEGRFVAEFGGKGNVETIVTAIASALKDYGISIDDRNPWYFPSIGEFSSLLEDYGLTVTYARHFERPTFFDGGESGLNHWLNMFSDDFFQGFSEHEKDEIFEKVNEATKEKLFKDGVWCADYKRIRVVAVKKG